MVLEHAALDAMQEHKGHLVSHGVMNVIAKGLELTKNASDKGLELTKIALQLEGAEKDASTPKVTNVTELEHVDLNAFCTGTINERPLP